MSETRYPSSVPSPFCIPRWGGRERKKSFNRFIISTADSWLTAKVSSDLIILLDLWVPIHTHTTHTNTQAPKKRTRGWKNFAHTRHVAQCDCVCSTHTLRDPQVRKVLIIGLVFFAVFGFIFLFGNFQKKLTLPVSSVSRLSPLVQISLTEASTTQRPITVFSVSKIKLRNRNSRVISMRNEFFPQLAWHDAALHALQQLASHFSEWE